MKELSTEDKDQARKALKAVITGLKSERNGPGRLVKTKSGKLGRTFNNEPLVNGKVPVFLDTGGRALCSFENLEWIGFVD